MWDVGINRGRLVYFEAIYDVNSRHSRRSDPRDGRAGDDLDRIGMRAGSARRERRSGRRLREGDRAGVPAALRRPALPARRRGMVRPDRAADRACRASASVQVGVVAVAPNAREYQRAIAASFFKRSPLVRFERLHAAWKAAPSLAGEFVAERAKGKKIDADEIWQDLWNTDELLWLQHVMLLEHKAARDHQARTRAFLSACCRPRRGWRRRWPSTRRSRSRRRSPARSRSRSRS
jgi:hypothetical protein